MRWKSALVLVTVLLLGFAGGILSDRVYLGTRKQLAGSMYRSPDGFMNLLAKELDLTEEQRAQIEPVVKRTHTEFWKLQQARDRARRPLRQEMYRHIRAVLTPEQIERYERFRQESRKIINRFRSRHFGAPPSSP